MPSGDEYLEDTYTFAVNTMIFFVCVCGGGGGLVTVVCYEIIDIFMCAPFFFSSHMMEGGFFMVYIHVLGKERHRKKPWVTKDVLDLCDERRDLKKKRYEAEGAKEYRETNRRIQKAVKKAKEDWIGAQ